MPRIFGFDIGTTSIGFAVIDHDSGQATGRILCLGSRIFSEARDVKGVPLNQERRQARLRRRQLRRRRERRRLLSDLLRHAGLLPARNSADWDEVMKLDPYDIRKRSAQREWLSPHEVGRGVYHLAQRRHFKGRDLDEISDPAASGDTQKEDGDEKKARTNRETTLKAFKDSGSPTWGAWLAEFGSHERKRGHHATRERVEQEFIEVWKDRLPADFRDAIHQAIFYQRPTFWRLNTLGECRFVPSAPLCPKGAWLSQQRRMLEKVNNLAFAGGVALDKEEREAILAKLQTQAKMSWSGARKALAPLYKKRGKPGAEKRLKFNLEEGGEKNLLGNALEAKLASIFDTSWENHPHQQDIRGAVHDYLWQADCEKVGGRVMIRSAAKRATGRDKAARRFVAEFGVMEAQAAKLRKLKLPTGWEPYSTVALQATLPHLEAGVRFSELINSPEWEAWRNETFPDNRVQPTGEVLDRLPSPADSRENKRLAGVRNPTVVRVLNELRKVCNNLIDVYGKPDCIRVELTREVGLSKRERDEKALGMRRQEQGRKKARADLEEKGIANPSRGDIEKWLLWKECGHRCPYTGDSISFEALFHDGEFEVEHIWPRSRSLDDSYKNKTLCRRGVNIDKGNQTPFEYLGHDAEAWAALEQRLDGMKKSGMSLGKIKRFLARSLPDDFANRQLTDTSYAAREAVASLKRLWPDQGPTAPVKVSVVSGRVTGHLRRLWGLNNVLANDGEKTRADHRHHAIDALVVACCHPGITKKLSGYWQSKDKPGGREPILTPPWKTIRSDAEQAVDGIVVSHRVRKKVSGALHKETIYGDMGKEAAGEHGTTYRYFVTRKRVEALSKRELEAIVDDGVREIVKAWVNEHGGDPGKAFGEGYPKRGHKGPEIRKVRLWKKQQARLMARVGTGYADLGNNHHMAIYRLPNGDVDYGVVSLLEASRRLRSREPVVQRGRGDGSRFLMSLSPGDSLQLTKNGETKIRVVESIWSSGQVVMVDHDDATGTTRFRPTAKSIVPNGAIKVSVDPIGRVRPAND